MSFRRMSPLRHACLEVERRDFDLPRRCGCLPEGRFDRDFFLSSSVSGDPKRSRRGSCAGNPARSGPSPTLPGPNLPLRTCRALWGSEPQEARRKKIPSGSEPQEARRKKIPSGGILHEARRKKIPSGSEPQEARRKKIPSGGILHEARRKKIPSGGNSPRSPAKENSFGRKRAGDGRGGPAVAPEGYRARLSDQS
jgi:hypothetical protein